MKSACLYEQFTRKKNLKNKQSLLKFIKPLLQQMRRTNNSEEEKRIIMDIDVVLKSHDCPYIVHCLGCFITDADVWICMELMATCFDKLTKKSHQPIPEPILGKITVAVSSLSLQITENMARLMFHILYSSICIADG